ncbi:hypothetical protein, variant [Salpingoeca rosetta]|uniref:Tripeptidyl-peptidase 2 n=1 Tax=Salpingoeca rosetta (strain ATCC 50818 / BSB-021) TaxID=946362 RepID=F2UQV9_SALR5|nr:hypothetical protein, variant [Salpingoeca rosetta]EGD80013.1 hypothetical protein, variant [Salpingoeca rosetta]|eukprot:XP_004988338.1 hypothetical protein, variant [Salpingoeca rosetta]
MTTVADNTHAAELSALIPAQETGALAIQRNDPECDGRGIRIAVFDTGVDPAALHLKTTTDGKPKIIDIVDTTGSGDVDMKKVVKLGDDRSFKTLTGRTFKVPEAWACPSGEVRVGVKAAFELFPTPLIRRLKRKRKEDWEKKARAVTRAAEAEETAAKDKTPDDEARLKELKARVGALSSHVGGYADHGPVLDCIAFNNGTEWMAVVADETVTDLSSVSPMGDYKQRQEYGLFSDEDQMSYSFKFYADGDILSIVTTSGSHGTHVAGILGAHDESSSERNGVAPGVQVVSVKIGDGRLDSMETGAGIIRGVNAAIDNGCHLINMSFGEASAVPNAGHVVRALQDAVREKGIIFIGSASNSGPALSTLGCPGGLSSALIGVGAYASSALMASSYALPHPVPDVQYTWSSRGPTPDGATGVCISAPGGAITDVPTYNLKSTQLMNGTSMSSPNMCGSAAVLLSALMKRGIPWSPFSVRKALENTAKPLSGSTPLDNGQGVAQVDKALDLLVNHRDDLSFLPEYKVEAGYFAMGGRGIYLRDPGHFTQDRVEAIVSVTPSFHKDTPKEDLIHFECPLSLVCDKSWVNVASFLLMNNSTRSFGVHVNTGDLEPGLHYTEIRAYRVGDADAGPVFRVPVTVCKPTPLAAPQSTATTSAVMSAGAVKRYFYAVPSGVTGCKVTVTGGAFEGSRRFILHAVQLAHQKPFNNAELHRFFALRERETTTFELAINGDRGLEVCVAQWWSSAGACDITITVEFIGLDLRGDRTFAGPARLDALCTLGKVTLQPKVQYTTLERVIFPVRAGTVRPLREERNVLIDGSHMYALELSYSFSLSDKANVYPVLPGVSDFLYEGDMHNQLWMIFDDNNRILQRGDAFPNRYKTDLKKGSYTIVYQLRHSSKSKLEDMKESHILLIQKLKSPLSASVYSVQPGTTAQQSFSKMDLVRGRSVPVFVEPVKASKLPKDAAHGDVLSGTITMAADAQWSTWCVRALVTKGKVKPAETTSSSSKKSKKNKKNKAYKDAIKAADLDFIKSATKDDVDVLAEIGERHAGALDVQLAVITKRFDLTDSKESLLPLIEEAVDSVDTRALAEYFGRTDVVEEETQEAKDAAAKRKEDMTSTKSNLIALLLLQLKCALELEGDARTNTARTAITNAKRWTDPYKDSKWALSLAKYHMAREEYGQALQCIGDETSKDAFELKQQLFDKLGWTDLFDSRSVHVLFPSARPLFVE